MATEIHTALSSIVGPNNTFPAGSDKAAPYHALFGFIVDKQEKFVAVVLPGNIEQVQAVTRLIKAESFCIWSTANAAGNGASISNDKRPAIIVDLQRMNQIIEVNEVSAYALVEPGVSYQQLYDHLQKNNIPLWIDCDRNPQNSIAGSICSRQIGYTPYGDHLQMQCGMELVLDDGELLRTGMGALPNSDTWQLFKYSFGPYWDGFFTQSNASLVTKIGLWLMPPPPVFKPFMLTLPRLDCLEAAIEVLRPLKIASVIPNTITIAHAMLEVAPYYPRSDFANGDTVDIDRLIKSTQVGVWNVSGALYGTQDNIDLSWEFVESTLLKIDGAKIFLEGDQEDDMGWQVQRNLMRGVPAQRPLNFDRWRGSKFMTLTTAAPMEGEAAMRQYNIVNEIVSAHNIDYLCEYLLPWRVMLKRIYLPYTPGDDADRLNVSAVAKVLIKQLTNAGYGIVHEDLELRHIANEFYQDSALARLVERIQSGTG